jgi:hypothetical protein
MVELIFRLCLASLIAYVSRTNGSPSFEVAHPLTTGYGLAVIALYVIGLRWSRLAVSLQASIDAALISIFAGASGSLNTFGFLALAPAIYAISRRNAHPLVASAAGTSMYLGFFLFAKGVPALDFHAKALAITIAATMALPRPISIPSVESDSVEFTEPQTISPEEPEELISLRETHRQLLDRYQALENERQRELALRSLATFRPLISPLPELCSRIAGATEAEAIALYVRSESADDLVIQGTFGDWSDAVRDSALPLHPNAPADSARWALESQIAELVGDAQSSTAVLVRDGRIIGLLLARSPREQAVKLHEIADAVATIVVEDAENRRTQNRLREAEILYSVASVAQGAQSRNSLAERIVRELSTLVKADGLAIAWTDEGAIETTAKSGLPFEIDSILQCAGKSGVEGWLHAGTPEIAAFRTLSDPHCHAMKAHENRIGSLFLIPLQSGDHPFGYLAAFTHRSGGLDTADLLSLRTIGIEVSRTLARINNGPSEEGLVSPSDFHDMTRAGGAIVYIEPNIGAVSTEGIGLAIRQFAHLVRSKLPAKGIVCRRDQGDLIAFLSDMTYESATRWANEIQAIASMVRLPEGTFRVRTKVAHLPSRIHNAA